MPGTEPPMTMTTTTITETVIMALAVPITAVDQATLAATTQIAILTAIMDQDQAQGMVLVL